MLQLNYSLPISQLFRYFTFLIASVGIVNSAPAEFFLESHTDAQFPARDSALGIEHNGSVWVMLRFPFVDFVWGGQPQLKKLIAG